MDVLRIAQVSKAVFEQNGDLFGNAGGINLILPENLHALSKGTAVVDGIADDFAQCADGLRQAIGIDAHQAGNGIEAVHLFKRQRFPQLRISQTDKMFFENSVIEQITRSVAAAERLFVFSDFFVSTEQTVKRRARFLLCSCQQLVAVPVVMAT